MNAFAGVDATPPEKSDPALAARAARARVVLWLVTAAMALLPVLLFLFFHT
jgi:hypothetical protein